MAQGNPNKPTNKDEVVEEVTVKPQVNEGAIAAAIAKAVKDQVAAEPSKVTVEVKEEPGLWAKTKAVLTSPTACTFGMLLASMVAGVAGGVAADEARARGYLKTRAQPQLPPPANH